MEKSREIGIFSRAPISSC